MVNLARPNEASSNGLRTLDEALDSMVAFVTNGKNLRALQLLRTRLKASHVGSSVVIEAEALSEGFRNVREIFGVDGDLMVYQLGLESGKRTLWRAGSHSIDLADVFRAAGWGHAFVTGPGAGSKVRVVLSRGFECSGHVTKRPYSQFIRGHLVGLFSQALVDPRCTEEKCAACGDEFCEFVIDNRAGHYYDLAAEEDAESLS